ncbi:MAG: SPFH domain-containing protein [Planctomycetota bacterium]|nr:SPFH domain-containing protein [Planctomycetota bacterium]
MLFLVLFTILATVIAAYAAVARLSVWLSGALYAVAALVFLAGLALASSVVIAADRTGVVIKYFGDPLPPGAIVARHGEQGPQARILGPGWHFGYFPLLYEVQEVPVMVIEHGKLGFVTAHDGEPLPSGEIYAKPWDSATEMLDPERFFAGGGQRGPQATVLTPGTYRYNPALHDIQTIDALIVAPGTVAVITARTGAPAPSESPLVNGVPLVPRTCRGIWREPLPPGAYYINTHAYAPTIVKTTQRVYTYQQQGPRSAGKGVAAAAAQQEDWSVTVRSRDGFSFPVDVRVVCAVEAAHAPQLVALLGDPDRHMRDEQEDEELEVLEARIILPTVRAIFRNVAEGMNALEFVNARSQVERVATERVKAELARYFVTCDGVYVGNIHLDATDAGRKLLATQTDTEVAKNQQTLYAEQRKAEEARAAFVKAQEEAEQQRNLAQATYAVKVKEQQAQARAAEARGEADYQRITGEGRAAAYRAMVEALGKEAVTQLELLKLVAEGRVQITPQVMVSAPGGALDALTGTLLRQAVETPPKR